VRAPRRERPPGFAEGFLTPLAGLGLIFRVPGARKVLLFSILGNLAAVVLLVGAGWFAWFTWGVSFLENLAGGWLGSLLVFGSGLLVAAVLLATAFLIFPVLVPVLSGPFHDPLARRIEAHLLGGPPPECPFSFLQGLLHDLSVTFKLLFLEILILAAAWISSFFLGSGLLVGLLLGSWLTALSWLDFPLARRGLSFREERAWVRAHLAPSMGFGLAVVLSFMVPLYNLFLAGPAAAAGASKLYIRVARAEGRP